MQMLHMHQVRVGAIVMNDKGEATGFLLLQNDTEFVEILAFRAQGQICGFVIRSMSISISSSSPVDLVFSENGDQQVELLSASHDEYGGITVDMKEPMDSKVFATVLRASMSQWKRQGKKGVWIELHIELVNLVETAVKEGFTYHHAEPKYLMLVYWIPETTSTLPANATHQVRVAAVVMNEKGEVLVVQEKLGKYLGRVWKIPTGVTDEGEDIFMAARREVKEETGGSDDCVIDTKFGEILAFSVIAIQRTKEGKERKMLRKEASFEHF